MRVYLDNCTFNRPFDDQRQARIQIETEAKLLIQRQSRLGRIELAWSYILDYEIQANPFDERRESICAWRHFAVVDTVETGDILVTARSIAQLGVKAKDALHLACAIAQDCEYFVTTDDEILSRRSGQTQIKVLDPTAFIREIDE